MYFASWPRRSIAALLAASLIITVPGPQFYEALALSSRSEKAPRQGKPSGRASLTDLLHSESGRDASGDREPDLDLADGIDRRVESEAPAAAGSASFGAASASPREIHEDNGNIADDRSSSSSPRSNWFSRLLDEQE